MRQVDEIRGEEAGYPLALSPAQREAILAEMNSILSDPAFSRSHRCVALLRCVIEHTVSGDWMSLKERTLGVEVFGRDCDYDSNADPIVRVTANDIRKRLAQYYQANDTPHRVRVRLTPGRYVPEFNFLPNDSFDEPAKPEPQAAIQAEALVQVQPEKHLERNAREPVAPTLRRCWALGLLLLLLLAGIGLALSRSKLFESAQEAIWRPLLRSGQAPTLCVGDNSALQQRGKEQLTLDEKRAKLQRLADMIQSQKAPAFPAPEAFESTTPFVDANVAHKVTSWLGDHGQSALLRPSSELTLQDFRNRPAVLVGGFDNPWSVILLTDMRFSLRVDAATGTFWVADAQNPARRNWERHVLEEAQPAVDYAVITRFLDTETGNWVLGIAGLGPHGTEAAGQLLTDPAFTKSVPAAVRSAQNFQLVIATKVINANTGPPQVMAVHTW